MVFIREVPSAREHVRIVSSKQNVSYLEIDIALIKIQRDYLAFIKLIAIYTRDFPQYVGHLSSEKVNCASYALAPP